MIKYFEWLHNQNDTNISPDGILENQLGQLITRLEGLLHDVPEAQKSLLVDKLVRQIEERILGL
jgi:hypothetical protein